MQLRNIIIWERNGYRIWRKELLALRKRARREYAVGREYHHRRVFFEKWFTAAAARARRRRRQSSSLQSPSPERDSEVLENDR